MDAAIVEEDLTEVYVDAPKVAVSIRLDSDVVEALRSSGEGWQSRTNEMLRKALGLVA